MPKLTVMIPVYNVENYLKKCLDSVIYPELDDYEIVLVNDGSTDKSGAICDEYAQHFPALIRVITTPNGGLGKALFAFVYSSGVTYMSSYHTRPG